MHFVSFTSTAPSRHLAQAFDALRRLDLHMGEVSIAAGGSGCLSVANQARPAAIRILFDAVEPPLLARFAANVATQLGVSNVLSGKLD